MLLPNLRFAQLILILFTIMIVIVRGNSKMSQTTTLSGRSRLWFVTTLLLGTFTMSISQSAVSTAYRR